jgi:uncharacterized protein (TIGR03083 family)
MIVRPRQTGQMDALRHSERLGVEGGRLLHVAASDLDAPVSTCPEWVVRDLVHHMGSVWQAIELAMANHSAEAPDLAALEPLPAGDDEMLAFNAATLARLVDSLGTADPGRPVWSWSADQTAGFFQRRAHHETLVHRIDVELAVDDRTPVDPADALDGIDELFSVVVSPTGENTPTGSFHLHRTDGDGEFMLAVTDGSITVTREHAKGDAALRGTAEDLWLAMWRRRSIEGMEFFGDEAIAAQWTGLAP